MKKEIKLSKKSHNQEEIKKNTPQPENLMRREAIKRIAFLALGSITGSVFLNSCDPYSDYSDYEDYYDYYSYYNYYSRYSNYYYDYYSRYSAYWD